MAHTESGGYSTTIPDHEASGNMQVEFSRNVKSFKVNQWSELRPVTKQRGFFLQIRPASAGRVRWPDIREYAWPDGAERPSGETNRLQFQFVPYFCQRYAHSVLLGNLAVEQASWPVIETELRDKGQQAMTAITDLCLNTLSGATWGSNTAAVYNSTTYATTSKSWTDATPTAPYIKKSLYAAATQINVATLGAIRPQDLVLVINPYTAALMAQTQEIHSILGNSVYAYPLITGTLPGTQENWSLPPKLYDFRVAVEDTVVVTSAKNSAGSDTAAYALPGLADGTLAVAYLLTRRENEFINSTVLAADEGRVNMTEEQVAAVPVYSTLVRFAMEEFTVEHNADSWNRINQSSVAYNIGPTVTNPISGFKFYNILAST